jgi:hypothetical protein
MKTLKRGRLCPSVSNIDAFPPIEASINRPFARSDQRQASAQGSQEDMSPYIPRLRKSVPKLEHYRKGTRERSPETCQQEYSQGECEQVPQEFDLRLSGHSIYPLVHECDAGNQPHQ